MNKPMRILHFTTHDEDCGIGKYQEQFLAAMDGNAAIENKIFPVSPNIVKYMPREQLTETLGELRDMLRDHDILHVQHELSFFKQDELKRLVDIAHELNKKVIITVHTAPAAQYVVPKRVGVSPRAFVALAKATKAANEFRLRYIDPLKSADLVLVHNTSTKNDLLQHGVPAGKISKINMPVPAIHDAESSSEIVQALNVKKDDIVFASIGFLSVMKGVDQAIKALNYLPSNYKLAIIGGIHPAGGQRELLDQLSDLIIQNNLKDRVYVTGYVQEDARLNALIRECDVCVYPYDPNYYSYVSSAALNNAFANGVAAITYPTASFNEINATEQVIDITKSPNYYELARSLKRVDIKRLAEQSRAFAEKYSYPHEALGLVDIYSSLLK